MARPQARRDHERAGAAAAARRDRDGAPARARRSWSTRSARTTPSSGQLVRELGLPRDALLSVIVRGEEALLPRGSTRIEAADRLHVMVREEVAEDMADLLERWRIGPVGLPPRRDAPAALRTAVFTHAAWTEDDGDAGFPKEVQGVPVAEQIRTRRDTRGALVLLVDGRFAVTGPSARDRRAAPAPALRPPPPGQRGGRRRARLVAGGDRRARALSRRYASSKRRRGGSAMERERRRGARFQVRSDRAPALRDHRDRVRHLLLSGIAAAVIDSHPARAVWCLATKGPTVGPFLPTELVEARGGSG